MGKEAVKTTRYKNCISAKYHNHRMSVFTDQDDLFIEMTSIQSEPDPKLSIQRNIKGNAHVLAFKMSRKGAAILAKILMDELNEYYGK